MDCEVGVRLAIVSLRRQVSGARVVVFAPALSPTLPEWLEQQGNVEWVRDESRARQGWDNKPHCLAALLERGERAVIWLDSDVILTGDFLAWLAGVPPDALVVAEEPRHLSNGGTRARAQTWRLPPGRERGFAVNTCVIRVTPAHLPLLRRWCELLAEPEYRRWQADPLPLRPAHRVSDQDALGALLGADEFAALEVARLRSGREIVHSGGLRLDTLRDRLARARSGAPLFLHAIAVKPWQLLGTTMGEANFNWWLLRLAQETSAYVAWSRRFRAEIALACGWLDHGTLTGRMLRLLGLGSDVLRGLPLVAAVSLATGLGLARRRRA